MSPNRIRLDAMLSSTSNDLPEHRERATEAAQRMGFYPVVMENLTAKVKSDAIKVSLEMVEDAELYIGIFGHRYGYVPDDPQRNPDKRSITELEYRRALELGMPTLIFIMDESYPPMPETGGKSRDEARAILREFEQQYFEQDPDGEAKLKALKGEVKTKEIVGFFRTPDDLFNQLLQALADEDTKKAARAYFEKRQAEEPSTGKAQVRATGIPPLPELYALPEYSDQNALFVGRANELADLDAWAQPRATQPVYLMEAIGGMGKSALTWKWLKQRGADGDFAGRFWFSFYEGGQDMTAFVRYLLAYLSQRNPDDLVSQPVMEMLEEVLRRLKDGRFLVVLDGLERVLVAYHRWDAAQMRDAAVPFTQHYRATTNPRDAVILKALAACQPSRLLMTSRLLPVAYEDAGTILRGVRHRKLEGLSHDDAEALWREKNITWSDRFRLRRFFDDLGGHSILLKLVAGQINKTRFAKNSFEKWYEVVGKEMDLFENMIAKRNHILQAAYTGLNDDAKLLLSQIAALGDSLDLETLQIFNPYLPEAPRKIAQARRKTLPRFITLLNELEDRGLLWWNRDEDVYDLHPVVRGYAFAMLTESDKPETFGRIVNFFEGQEKARKLDEEMILEDLQPYIKMYNALLAAGNFDRALSIFDEFVLGPLYGVIGDFYRFRQMVSGLFDDETNALHSDVTDKARVLFLYVGALSEIYSAAVPEQAIQAVLLESDNYSKFNLDGLLACLGMQLARTNRLAASKLLLEAYADVSAGDETDMLHKWEIGVELGDDLDMSDRPRFANVELFHYFALAAFYQERDLSAQLAAFDEAYQKAPVRDPFRRVERIKGEVARREGRYEDALEHYNTTITIGNESGIPREETVHRQARGGLALTHLALGNAAEAAAIVREGCDQYAAARVLTAQGEHDAARDRAIAYYTWAWADGEPYVHRWHLKRARDLLDEMGIAHPDLPDYVPQSPAFPAEAAIRAYVERVKAKRAK